MYRETEALQQSIGSARHLWDSSKFHKTTRKEENIVYKLHFYQLINL